MVSLTQPHRVLQRTARARAFPGKVKADFLPSRTLYPPAVFVPIRHIPDSAVKVKELFLVLIEPMDSRFLATSAISEVYELGESRAEAVRNYLATLVEHFHWLIEKEPVLAPSVHKELDLLGRYLQI